MTDFADLGRAIGVATPEDAWIRQPVRNFLECSRSATEELETPTLAEFGIDKEEIFAVIEKDGI